MRLRTDWLATRRYENKYLLDRPAAAALEARLALVAGSVNEPVQWITTLYLDCADAALCRRLALGRGAGSRIRLRAYGMGTGSLFLERKHHRAGQVRKTRIEIAPGELRGLIDGTDPRGRQVGIGRLVDRPVPICVVRYERRIFRDAAGAFRFTIDHHLGAATPPPDWIDRLGRGELPEVPALANAPVVIECKHLGKAPRWLVELLAPHAAPDFSKLTWAWRRLRSTG